MKPSDLLNMALEHAFGALFMVLVFVTALALLLVGGVGLYRARGERHHRRA